MNHRFVVLALLSAALFGISTPAAKALLGSLHPALLAGLLYCGAGIGVAVVRRLGGIAIVSPDAPEVRLTRQDMPWLTGAIVAGGIVGPILLMAGLARTDAASASLLLTLEGVVTALLAWFVFKENFDQRVALGMGFLVAGAAFLAWSGQPGSGSWVGSLLIVVACFAWGIDNNLTRKVSLADPLQIVEIKGLVAGPVNILLASVAGAHWPSVSTVAVASIVGFVGYGLSLVLFILALRHLGTARTGAYFSTAPFIGAVAAVAFLSEPITAHLVVAGALMAVGVWLHLTECHNHSHEHTPMNHAHPHIHDEHHQHVHSADDPPGEPHTHPHSHGYMIHQHPHFPDMHHTHRH